MLTPLQADIYQVKFELLHMMSDLLEAIFEGIFKILKFLGRMLLEGLFEYPFQSHWRRFFICALLTGIAVFFIYFLAPSPIPQTAHIAAVITAFIGWSIGLYWQLKQR